MAATANKPVPVRSTEEFESLRKDLTNPDTEEFNRAEVVARIMENIRTALKDMELSEEDILHWTEQVLPEVEKLHELNAEVEDASKKSVFEKAEKKVMADLIDTQVALMTILRNPKLEKDDKIKQFNTEIDAFKTRMSAYEHKPGFGKKFALGICRVLGAIAGILLAPAVPFATAYSFYQERKKKGATLDRAIAAGIGGFVVGIFMSPMIGAQVGIHKVNESRLGQSFKADKALAASGAKPAASKALIDKFNLFHVNASKVKADEEANKQAEKNKEEKVSSPNPAIA